MTDILPKHPEIYYYIITVPQILVWSFSPGDPVLTCQKQVAKSCGTEKKQIKKGLPHHEKHDST